MMNKRKLLPWILVILGIILSAVLGGITITIAAIAVGIVFLSKDAAPLRIFAYGTLISTVILGASLLFINPPQCPDTYTQAQMDSSRCIVGANIGLGLGVMLAIGIWIMTILAALARYIQIKLAK